MATHVKQAVVYGRMTFSETHPEKLKIRGYSYAQARGDHHLILDA